LIRACFLQIHLVYRLYLLLYCVILLCFSL
jgi:hypothetical protein